MPPELRLDTESAMLQVTQKQHGNMRNGAGLSGELAVVVSTVSSKRAPRAPLSELGQSPARSASSLRRRASPCSELEGDEIEK